MFYIRETSGTIRNSQEDCMSNEAIAPSQSKREFSVADEHIYNRASPARWIISHLLRYPYLLVSFLLAATLTNVLFSTVPRLTGLAFDEVLKPEPSTGRLLTIALSILGLVIVRGLLDMTNSWSVETLGQRMERDAREELYISLLGKSQTFHDRQRVGDIMARATDDMNQMYFMISPGFIFIQETVMGLTIPVIWIATIRLELLLVPILFIVTHMVVVRGYSRRLNPVVTNQR